MNSTPPLSIVRKAKLSKRDLDADGLPRVKRPYKARKRTRSPTAIMRSRVNRRCKANGERGGVNQSNNHSRQIVSADACTV